MAEPIQLDKAAALVGKSEVTLRRLIKADKIPYQKEKTLTGFIYLVDPDTVKAYYQLREGGSQGDEAAESFAAFSSGEDSFRPEPTYMPKQPDPVRIAVAGESGNAYEYWQKKSELYEDKYNTEVTRHAQAREELGVWRGRAEQAQSMLIKLLPSPEASSLTSLGSGTSAKSGAQKPATQSDASSAERAFWPVVTLVILAVVLLCAVGGGILYLRFGIGQ